MSEIIHLTILTGIFIILAIGLNIAVGYTGLINFGYIAFYGIGAYTSAILVLAGWPWLVAFFLAGAAAALCGWLVAVITQKLNSDYLALATLGFGFVAHAIFLNWTSLTRGPLGIPGIPKPVLFGWRAGSPLEYLVLVFIVSVFAVYFLYRLTSSRYGKLLAAVRDDVRGAAALGKNIFRLKNTSILVSTFLAGLAGSLYAHYVTYIDPSAFFLSEIIVVFTILIVGGLASLRGSVIAGAIIVIVPELLRLLAVPSSILGPLRQIFYALILLVILLWRPTGLFGKVELE